MKRNSKSSVVKNPLPSGQNLHRYTFQQATLKFISECPLADDSGGNSYVRSFLDVMDRLTAVSQTFVLSDVIRECSHREIPYEQAKSLFLDKWLPVMERLNKIENLGSLVYSEDTFLVHR